MGESNPILFERSSDAGDSVSASWQDFDSLPFSAKAYIVGHGLARIFSSQRTGEEDKTAKDRKAIQAVKALLQDGVIPQGGGQRLTEQEREARGLLASKLTSIGWKRSDADRYVSKEWSRAVEALAVYSFRTKHDRKPDADELQAACQTVEGALQSKARELVESKQIDIDI